MTERQFDDVLDECLAHLTEEGASVEACLVRYPEHAAELRPLLETVAAMQCVPQPGVRQEAIDGGKERMLAAVRERQREAAKETNAGLLDRWARWLEDLTRPFGWQVALATAAALLVVVLSAGVLLAGPPSATVARTARLDPLQGLVEVSAADSAVWQPAGPDQPLVAGDQVRTGADGVARLTFFDGSTTALDGSTEVTLVELSSRRDGMGKAIVVRQQSGQTKHEVEPLRWPGARFQVRTPTAVTEVRGTAFDVAVDADGETRVAVWRGLVEVKRLIDETEDEVTMVSLQPGWFTSVRPNEPPSEPVVVSTPRDDQPFAWLPTVEPTETAQPTDTPVSTLTPTLTPTVVPTRTPRPTDTPVPTATPVPPSSTATPVPLSSTATPVPPTLTATPMPPTPTLTPILPTPTWDGPGDPEPTLTPTSSRPGDPEPTATPTLVGPGDPEPTATPDSDG